MAWWLVYERCDDCDLESCLQCKRVDRQLTLRRVEADEMPQDSLNGPCASAQEILTRIGEFFSFDEDTGIMYFKVEP